MDIIEPAEVCRDSLTWRPRGAPILSPFMERSEGLRRKAKAYRRVAGYPTQGGSIADRVLEELAERLEREADVAERSETGAAVKARRARTEE